MEFQLPDIGEGVAEGEIVRWLVSSGDTVAEDQPLVEVMTDKATVTIPAPAKGTVSELRAEEGETVAVGAVIAVFSGAEGGAAESAPASSSSSSSSSGGSSGGSSGSW